MTDPPATGGGRVAPSQQRILPHAGPAGSIAGRRGAGAQAIGILIAVAVVSPLLALVPGCAEPGRATAHPPAARGVTLDLAVRLRPQGVTHAMHAGPDGSGAVQTSRAEGYGEVEDDPVPLEGAPALARAIDAVFEDLATLPRWAHTPSSFAGVKVVLRARRGERQVAFDGFNTWLPPLAQLARVLREVGKKPVLPIVEALEDLERHRGQETWSYTPGTTDPERLLDPLDPPSPDAELRHLALDILAGEARDEFAARLRDLYLRQAPSLRMAPGGGRPDYFLALALLRLGDPVGLERVVEVARSPHPRWSAEAAGALEALFGDAYGKPIALPPPAAAGGDPAGEAIEAFRKWYRAQGRRFVFDRGARAYRRAPGLERPHRAGSRGQAAARPGPEAIPRFPPADPRAPVFSLSRRPCGAGPPS